MYKKNVSLIFVHILISKAHF